MPEKNYKFYMNFRLSEFTSWINLNFDIVTPTYNKMEEKIDKEMDKRKVELCS